MFSRFETPAHPNRTRGIAEIVFGVIAMVVGVGLSLRSIDDAQRAAEATGTGTYSIYLGLIVGAIFALARGIHDVYATAAVRSRSREERIVRDLVIGAALAVLVIVTALSLSGRALWANGLIVTTGLLLTIALLLIGRGLAMRWPEAQLAHDGSITEPGTGLRAAIGITVTGFALLALGIWRGAGADTSSVFEVFAIHALVVAGLGFATEGVARWRSALPDKVTRVSVTADAEVLENAERRRRRMIIEIVAGGILVLAGLVVLTVVYTTPSRTVADHVAAYGPIVGGLAIIVRALMSGFKSFVAWRYLLVFEVKVTARARIAVMLVLGLASCMGLAWAIGHYTTSSVFDATSSLVTRPLIIAVATFFAVAGVWGVVRHSKLAFVIVCIAVVVLLASMITTDILRTFAPPKLPDDFLTVDTYKPYRTVTGYISIGAGAVAGLAVFFGTLRAFFTFFTTVPIGGVWIGTAALVCVLSVMSGFETDLRDKILGSNAHIQITREDGAFTDWRDVKTRIDKLPGVVASTPYAVSEVVIAAHNNGMNVIIKGIDPATVGEVTDLIEDLEDPRAIERLEPKEDTSDRVVPQLPQPHGPDVIDPPPPDLPSGGEPIDFSGPDDEGSAAAPPTDRSLPPPPDTDTDLDGSVGAVVDPPPDDLLTTDAPPDDYSAPDSTGDRPPAIGVTDLASEPSMIRRIESLPGVLVGRELVKQTHMYTGEEVRIVSPLSDPSNPDATGTPIPFNRDFRVAGTFYTGMYEYDLKYIYVTLETLQDFLDRGEEIDGIEVRIADPDDTRRFVPTATSPGLIREALGPGYRVADWRELNRSLFAALSIEKIGMFIVLGIVILVASFSIVGNLIMVVVEKAREIALLKTLGASDFAVTQLFAIQGLMIGVIGTVLGVATGLLGCWAGKRYGIPLNPDVYYIDRLPVHIEAASVVAAAIAGVVISILATLYPALLAARVRPAAGMRH